MKVLTAAQMREVDRRTIEMGIPGIILMENAAHAVVREMVRIFGSLSSHRIIVYCGKGNNGGDGLAIARLLTIHHKPAALHVMLVYPESDFDGDAAANLKMLKVPAFLLTPSYHWKRCVPQSSSTQCWGPESPDLHMALLWTQSAPSTRSSHWQK